MWKYQTTFLLCVIRSSAVTYKYFLENFVFSLTGLNHDFIFIFFFRIIFFVGIQALKTKSEKATEESPKRKRKGTIKINLFHK